METLEQNNHASRALYQKSGSKVPAPESDDETSQMTDIHVRVSARQWRTPGL